MKYGLYDRPELKTWHKGRVVLLGDAAHPTSPVRKQLGASIIVPELIQYHAYQHLGQGANQAFEDIYHLILALRKNNISATEHVSTAALESAFQSYEEVRI